MLVDVAFTGGNGDTGNHSSLQEAHYLIGLVAVGRDFVARGDVLPHARGEQVDEIRRADYFSAAEDHVLDAAVLLPLLDLSDLIHREAAYHKNDDRAFGLWLSRARHSIEVLRGLALERLLNELNKS